MGEGENNVLVEKCTRHDMEISQLKTDVTKLEYRVKDVEKTVIKHGETNIKVEATIEAFEEKVESIENTLKEIVTELKQIGNKLVAYQMTNTGTSKSDLISWQTAFAGNNKIMLIIVATICIALLILLGVGADDLIKAFIGGK